MGEFCKYFNKETNDCKLLAVGIHPIPTLNPEGNCANKGVVGGCNKGLVEGEVHKVTIIKNPTATNPQVVQDNPYLRL